MHMAPTGACLFLDPVGVTREAPGDQATPAKTSTGKDVFLWLEDHSRGISFFGASCPKTPDPYGGDAIPSFLEVVCVDKGLALLCLRTPHRGVPTDYFAYDIANRSLPRRLPEIQPEIYCSSSVGLLRNSNKQQYVVANLRLDFNEETDKMEAHIDRWTPDWNDEKWSQPKVNPDFHFQTANYTEADRQDHMFEWQTDQVVTLEDNLLWVDLWRGIQLSSDLLSCPKDQTPNLMYLPLPNNLAPKRPVEDAHHRREWPEPFRSVSCCKGKLIKLVNLHSPPQGNSLQIQIWILHTTDWSWSKGNTYEYPWLWETVNEKFPWKSLPEWKDKPQCFPLLSTHNSNVLYLTLSANDKAVLVRINVKDKDTVRITEYPPFCKHRNLLRLVDLPKGCTDPTAEWEKLTFWKSPAGLRNSMFGPQK